MPRGAATRYDGTAGLQGSRLLHEAVLAELVPKARQSRAGPVLTRGPVPCRPMPTPCRPRAVRASAVPRSRRGASLGSRKLGRSRSRAAPRDASGGWTVGYSRVLTGYSQGTHGVLQEYSQGTHGCSQGTHRVLTGAPGVLGGTRGGLTKGRCETWGRSGARVDRAHAGAVEAQREGSGRYCRVLGYWAVLKGTGGY